MFIYLGQIFVSNFSGIYKKWHISGLMSKKRSLIEKDIAFNALSLHSWRRLWIEKQILFLLNKRCCYIWREFWCHLQSSQPSLLGWHPMNGSLKDISSQSIDYHWMNSSKSLPSHWNSTLDGLTQPKPLFHSVSRIAYNCWTMTHNDVVLRLPTSKHCHNVVVAPTRCRRRVTDHTDSETQLVVWGDDQPNCYLAAKTCHEWGQ